MSQSKTKRDALNQPKLIQLIHIGKSKLCLDDDTYRSLLVAMTGKDSTKAMNLSELQTVLSRMRKLGFVPTRATPTTQKASKDNGTTDQLNLIRHLWHSLHALGAVRVNTETAMASYIKKQSGVSIDDLDVVQASSVIESLKKWHKRVENQTPNPH